MDRPITWVKTHPDPQNFQRLGNRDELTALREGQQLRVVGYLLRAKLELVESPATVISAPKKQPTIT